MSGLGRLNKLEAKSGDDRAMVGSLAHENPAVPTVPRTAGAGRVTRSLSHFTEEWAAKMCPDCDRGEVFNPQTARRAVDDH